MFNNPKGGRPILEGRLTLFNMDTNSLFCVKKKDTQTLNCSFLPALRGVNTRFCIGRIVRFSQLINRNLTLAAHALKNMIKELINCIRKNPKRTEIFFVEI